MDEGHDSPYSPAVDEGIVRAIYDYEGHWTVPGHLEASEDDYSEDSFA